MTNPHQEKYIPLVVNGISQSEFMVLDGSRVAAIDDDDDDDNDNDDEKDYEQERIAKIHSNSIGPEETDQARLDKEDINSKLPGAIGTFDKDDAPIRQDSASSFTEM